MATHQVIGIYSSVARARLVLEALVVEGMPEARVAISTNLAEDGIAAEAPGQSYVNQPSDRGGGWFGSWRGDDGGTERKYAGKEGTAGNGAGRHGSGFADAVHSGACVVTAEARSSEEAHRVRDVMTALHPVEVKVPVLA